MVSLTLFILWMDEGKKELGALKYLLAAINVGLSFLMFSRFRYPSFKNLHWKTKKSLPAFLAIILILFATAMNPEWMPAAIFLSYLLYGLVRPLIGRKLRFGFEEAFDSDAEPAEAEEEVAPEDQKISGQ